MSEHRMYPGLFATAAKRGAGSAINEKSTPENNRLFYPDRVNTGILRIFESDYVVGTKNFVELYILYKYVCTFYALNLLYHRDAWIEAGQFIHRAIELELISEIKGGINGERAWRLLSREPRFVGSGNGTRRNPHVSIQVRGLPYEEQQLQYKREASATKLSATLDRKARAQVSPSIAFMIERILIAFPPAQVSAKMVAVSGIGESYIGAPVSETLDVLSKAHETSQMTREQIKKWHNFLVSEIDKYKWATIDGVDPRAPIPRFGTPETVPLDDLDVLGRLA